MRGAAWFASLTFLVGLLSPSGSPLCAQQGAQRGGPALPDTPHIMVATFASSDPQLGIQLADEIRKRLESEHSANELFVVPKFAIHNPLSYGRLPVDTALSVSDLMELASQMRADQVVDGTVDQTAVGVRVNARLLFRTGDGMFAQPLPRVPARDIHDAAEQLAAGVTSAEQMLPSYRACQRDLLARKDSEAVLVARRGLADYPSSVLDQACILDALAAEMASPDSIIAVADAIWRTDSMSIFAARHLLDAYERKGDTTSAIEAGRKVCQLERLPAPRYRVLSITASGSPFCGLLIVDSLLKQSPGDTNALRTKWLLELRADQYGEALATGEELANLSPSAVTLDYFERQIGAAEAAGDPAAIQRFAALATQRFPKDPNFPLVLAQSYRRAGQLQRALQAAERGAEIEPKSTLPWRFAITIAGEMNQADTVVAVAQRAIASGASKDTVGSSLLAAAAAAVKKAQESKSRDDWMVAFKLARGADNILPSARSKNVIGLSAVEIAASVLDDARAQVKGAGEADREAACDAAKQADEMLTTASLTLRTAAVSERDSTAQTIARVQQYADSLQRLKASCQRTR